jgi:hypothetical protein
VTLSLYGWWGMTGTHPHSPGPEAPAGEHAAGAPGAGGAGAGPPSPGSYHPSEQEIESQDCPFNKKAPGGAGGAGAGPPSPGSYHPSEQETELQDCLFNKKHHEEQEVQEPGLLPGSYHPSEQETELQRTVPLTKSTTRSKRCSNLFIQSYPINQITEKCPKYKPDEQSHANLSSYYLKYTVYIIIP